MSKQVNLDVLLAPTKNGAHIDAPKRESKHKHPTGWEPTVRMDKKTGQVSEIVSVPVESEGFNKPESLHQAALVATLEANGVTLRDDQEAFIVEIKQGVDWFRGEQGEDAVSKPSTRIKWAVRFREPITQDSITPEELEKLWKQADGISKKARPAAQDVERSLWVSLADWQLGQADGTGLRGQVARAAAIPGVLKAEVARLKKAGTPVSRIILAGLGDIVEGCDGFYANQAFTVQADRREQIKIARRLILRIVTAAAETGLDVLVTGIAGNHAENRSNGKLFTTTNDNDDLAILEQVYDIVEGRPGYEKVIFSIPTDRLVATFDVHGFIVAITHGHIFPRGAGGAAEKTKTWIKGQALAREAAADADIIVNGHLHHESMVDIGGRLAIQAPALCDRSQHFAERYGMVSRAGLQTFTIGGNGEGRDNYRIHNLDVNIEFA